MTHGLQTGNPFLRRLPRWAWAVLALLLLAALWWLRQPREMRLVGRYPLEMGSVDFQSVTAELTARNVFLTDQRTFSTSVYDLTGQLRWQVKPNLPQVKSIKTRYSTASSWSSSPDERWQAIIIKHKTYHELYGWEEGRLVSRLRIPLIGKPMQVQVLNNGTIYCWETYTSPTPIYLVKGNRIHARGTLTPTPGASVDPIGYVFTNDGTGCVRATVDGFTYYRVQIKGTKLAFVPAYTASEPPIQRAWGIAVPNMPYLGAGNVLVADSGARYDAHGRLSPKTGWRLHFPVEFDRGQRALVQARYTDSDALPVYRNAVRILDTKTGKAWEIKPRLPRLSVTATPDGRYALVDEDPRLARAKLLPMFIRDRFPGFSSWYDERLSEGRDMRLLVYQQPGRLRACLRLRGVFWQYGYVGKKFSAEFYGEQLSPDGHTVYALAKVAEKGKERMEVLYFRW